MKFSAFIRSNLEAIVIEWESFAKTLLPSSHPSSALVLRDHAGAMLTAIALDMDSPQTVAQRVAKSKNQGHEEAIVESAAAAHGALRQLEGLDISQLLGEFRAMRASVLAMWRRAALATDAMTAIEEIARFNEGIDQAIAESVEHYAKNVANFMTVISRDLRSPLWAIKGSSEMLSTRNMSEELRREVTDRITRSAEAMTYVVSDLGEFAESHLGRAEAVTVSSCDLGEVGRSSVEAMQARHPRQEFLLTAAGNLVLKADPRRMKQVFVNLLNTAVHHNERRSPILIDLHGGPDSIVIRVSGYGRATAGSALKSLLEPTGTGAGANEGPYTGLGVGLFIVREILCQHGGSIAVESEPATGTAYTIEVPR